MQLTGDVAYLLAGVALLAGAVLPRLLRRRAISTPIAFVAVGLLIGLLPLPGGHTVTPVGHEQITEHLTEVTVIIALMGVGLAIDRPLHWQTWGTTWRLLLIAMPLCIVAVAALGWGLMGLAPASALLLAAALAPTDPVLASDVQVEGPDVEGGDAEPTPEEDDEVRFGLTSEAGLNDGAAFPFVFGAILLAGSSTHHGGWGTWIGWYVVGKLLIALVVGALSGWALTRLAFRAPVRSLRLAEAGEPMLAIAATLGVYGLTDVLGGYGFVAVFVAGVSLRSFQRTHAYHAALHDFVGQLEHMLTWMLLLLLGAALTDGLLASLTWQGVVLAVLLVFLVRPVVAWASLWGNGMTQPERYATAFFGVRGIGSVFYLAYATGQATFPERRELWSTMAFTVVLSVVVHGVTATPVMNRLDAVRGRVKEGAA
ncbi:MAG TPA: cation:proton antiporter [Actinomycetales bacterium]|nr:cation:proton antiporter [Actinomycetales bacterium]